MLFVPLIAVRSGTQRIGANRLEWMNEEAGDEFVTEGKRRTGWQRETREEKGLKSVWGLQKPGW